MINPKLVLLIKRTYNLQAQNFSLVIGLSFHHLIHSSFLILIHPYLQAQTYIGDEIIHPVIYYGLVIILESLLMY
ncbi:hypothetical protein HYD76_02450 [Mycoplasmopsis bovis]|nr:hypothetical protein [Mycoplasmopsis bovis]QQH48685.1 hypothetical protein HYD76_02450 [Mycoplasmopsis bovis]